MMIRIFLNNEDEDERSCSFIFCLNQRTKQKCDKKPALIGKIDMIDNLEIFFLFLVFQNFFLLFLYKRTNCLLFVLVWLNHLIRVGSVNVIFRLFIFVQFCNQKTVNFLFFKKEKSFQTSNIPNIKDQHLFFPEKKWNFLWYFPQQQQQVFLILSQKNLN